MSASEPRTFLDGLVGALTAAAEGNPRVETAPAGVIWPDPDGEWQPLIPLLRGRLPLFVLGPYAPDDGSGPCAWLRCVTAGVIEDRTGSAAVPVIYLPGYAPAQLRSPNPCPPELELLVELAYRGALWTRRDGLAWTVDEFVRNPDGGLGIELRGGAELRRALLDALPHLAQLELERLRRDMPWRAADFAALNAPAQGPARQTGVLELAALGESSTLEFKATARWNLETRTNDQALVQSVVKTVGAFLNGDTGGTLLIGVTDDGAVCGLDNDYRLLGNRGSKRDQYERWLRRLLNDTYGIPATRHVDVTFEAIDGADVCRVSVSPSAVPALAKDNTFYVRSGNATESLSMRGAFSYMHARWPDWRE